MRDIASTFESPAVPLLIELQELGFACEVTETGALHIKPGGKLTQAQRAQLTELKDDVIDLLKCCDDGVVARREVFRRQIAESSGNTLPTFVFVPGITYRAGWCFSCNASLRELAVSRCQRCSLAMRLALISVGVRLNASALDGARVA